VPQRHRSAKPFIYKCNSLDKFVCNFFFLEIRTYMTHVKCQMLRNSMLRYNGLGLSRNTIIVPTLNDISSLLQHTYLKDPLAYFLWFRIFPLKIFTTSILRKYDGSLGHSKPDFINFLNSLIWSLLQSQRQDHINLISNQLRI